MTFPNDDEYWRTAKDYLLKHADPNVKILAPNEFLEVFPGSYHYHVSDHLEPAWFEFAVIHNGMLEMINPHALIHFVENFHPVFGNGIFVIYSRSRRFALSWRMQRHTSRLLEFVDALRQQLPDQESEAGSLESFASVVTTYNRPRCLQQSLPQLVDLGAPVVVVDDGSAAESVSEVVKITGDLDVPLIRMPKNRGLPNAINVGISYWLSDPEIRWISCFQDDVDVHPDVFKVLLTVQHKEERPLLSGRDASEHPLHHRGTVNGVDVLYKRSLAGIHLHAHRDYWRSVLPVPSPYLGAPKAHAPRVGQGADEDWWITAWAPESVTKRGRFVTVVPGLVRTFNSPDHGSTWDNEFAETLVDPPLGARGDTGH